VQVIVEKAEKSDIPDIDKKKWACPPCHHSVLLLHCMAVWRWQRLLCGATPYAASCCLRAGTWCLRT